MPKRKSDIERSQDVLIAGRMKWLDRQIATQRASTETSTRYIVGHDLDATFEESNGEPRPLTQDEYRGNEYRACPIHPRAGTKTIDATVSPNIQGCAQCGRTDYVDVSYVEYRAYYGNPDRHVYLFVQREDKCPCCETWHRGDNLYGIDCMDDNPEVRLVGTHTLDELTGYIREVAEDLEEPTFKTKG